MTEFTSTLPFDSSSRLSDGRLRHAAFVRLHNFQPATTHGILIALDLESMDAQKRIIECTTDVEGVVGYKLGLAATLRVGLTQAVREARSVTSLPLIYDHQKAGPDVPDMAAKFAAICSDAGVDGLILFPLAGPRAVAKFVEQALKHRLAPIVGGELPFSDYNASGGGYVIDGALEQIFRAAIPLGTNHFVVPGNTPDKVRYHAAWLMRELESPGLLIPGIGPLGGSIEQTFSAAPGCRVYAVVGRAVYEAPDPRDAARRLGAEALRFAA
jgi:orotidine-5'-phosphate decarboxylase